MQWQVALPGYENEEAYVTIGLIGTGRPYLKATTLPWVDESFTHSTKKELMLYDGVHQVAYFISIKDGNPVLEVLT